MALNYQSGNYVKFIRGTTAAWDLLSVAEKNSDTLYFISDVGSAYGSLYLGEKLIAQGNNLSGAASLGQLNDVLLNANLLDKSILMYDVKEEKWKDYSILEVIAQIGSFTGATAEEVGISGLVPAPSAGQQDLFLRGDGTWANPVSEVSNSLEELTSVVNALVGEDSGKTIREISAEEASAATAKIVADAPEAYDTLKEIATWIQNNEEAGTVPALSNKISAIEDILNGTPASEGVEEVPGLISIVDSLNLDNEQNKTNIGDLQEVTSDLEERVKTLEDDNKTLTDDVKNIKSSLTWQEIVAE